MSEQSNVKRTKAKSSAIEYQKRVETIRSLLLSGMDTDAIVQNVTSQWGVKPRMIYRYLAVAREKNKAFIEFHEAEMFSHHIAVRRHILGKALAANDFRAALAAAKDEAQLMGLYASDRQQADYLKWLTDNGLSESEAITQFRALLSPETTGDAGSGAGEIAADAPADSDEQHTD